MGLLEVTQLGIQFGGLKAVDDFSLSLDLGEIVAIIGPNGAGKTTVFNIMTGIYAPSTGSIFFDNVNIVGEKAHQIANLGLVRTFQNIRLFKDLTVQKNVEIALHRLAGYSLSDSVMKNRRYKEDERKIREKALEILTIFQLENKASEKARNLPYGQQRKLEIARALALSPRILLLDEPAAGMNQNEINSLVQLIRFVRDQYSLSILLIEHQMGLVMSLSERILVMNYGRVISQGSPEEIRNDPRVIEAYLGRRR
ncbi:MAG: ABC transporter ATP-binding protein [Synergistota bacterium]|nr:ABC transporter ATP-binding protein [Synergistota bacterium]